MIFVHAFAGAICTQNILKIAKKKFSKTQLNIIWFLGVVGGIFPDFDIILPFFNRDIEHRKLLTHSIIPYLVLFLFINLIVFYLRVNKDTKRFIKMSNLVFLIGVASHIVLDYFVGGLQMFSPLTDFYFGYHLPFNVDAPTWQYMYFLSYYMLSEVIIGIWFISIFKNIKNNVGKYLSIFFCGVSIIATILFMYS